MQIIFDIPIGQSQRVIDAFNGLYKMPIIGEDEYGKPIPEFTESLWAKECVRRYMKNVVLRWERTEAAKVARAAITVDDSIVT